jgi:hypothetical protein
MERPRSALTRMMARVVRAAPVCLALAFVLPQICHGGRAELGERMYRSAGIGWRRIGFTEPQYKLVAASSPRQKKTV